MFHPEMMIYKGRNQGIDTFYYGGIRIDAILTSNPEGQYICVGLGQHLPHQLLDEMLSWFGFDQHQQYSRHEFSDSSCYYVQKFAA